MIPTVLVTGPPAVGKSFLRADTAARWKSFNANCVDLGVDDVLRRMLQEGALSPNEAWIDSAGAIILRDPRRSVPIALGRLFQDWESLDVPSIVEAPLNEEFLYRLLDAKDLCSRSAIVFLSAPLELRLERNRNRHESRISEAGLLAMPNNIPYQLMTDLSHAVPNVLHINTSMEADATTRELRCMLSSIEQAMVLKASGRNV